MRLWELIVLVSCATTASALTPTHPRNLRFATPSPVPSISSMSPSSAAAGGVAFKLTVNGGNFVAASEVIWNGAALPTSFVGATQLTAQISSAAIASAGTAKVDVFSPAPGGGTSGSLNFLINRGSAGCAKTGVQTGKFSLTTTDGNNTTRTFLMQVPTVYYSTKAYSLNFVFHGAGGNSASSYSWGLQNAPGASQDGIFVFPDGIAYLNYGIGWNDNNNGYDLPFFDNMVKNLEANYCVDDSRVFATGFSWGGDFVTALSCARGDVLRAAAVNSATDEFSNNADYRTYANLPCPTAVHPPLRYEHAVGADSAYPAPDFASTSLLFQSFNSCSSSSTTYPSTTNTMTCASYNNCAKQLIECPFNASLGHTLPPNWASDTWSFFTSFP